MTKRACVLLADGFEETEAVAVIDVLRRADIKVEVLGVESKKVTGSHQICIEADALLSDRKSEKFDLVVLPGACRARPRCVIIGACRSSCRRNTRAAGSSLPSAPRPSRSRKRACSRANARPASPASKSNCGRAARCR